jgi:hypothetical protein
MIGVKKIEYVQFDSMKKSTDKLREKWLEQTGDVVRKG